jgi:hypothetical protein
MKIALILSIVAIVAVPILMFADAEHTIELPIRDHTDSECEEAVFFMDRYFRENLAVRRVRFTNEWVPFANPLSRDYFYLIFADCLIHGGACHPFPVR